MLRQGRSSELIIVVVGTVVANPSLYTHNALKNGTMATQGH